MKIFRNRLLTFQEHLLIGSTVSRKYSSDPYKPLAVIDGEITPEECNSQRREREDLQGELWNVLASTYWGVRGLFGVASLEPLNLDNYSPEYGRTTRDPQLLRLLDNSQKTQKGVFPFERTK